MAFSAVALNDKAKTASGYYTFMTELYNACYEAAEQGEFKCDVTLPKQGMYQHVRNELLGRGYTVELQSYGPTRIVISW